MEFHEPTPVSCNNRTVSASTVSPVSLHKNKTVIMHLPDPAEKGFHLGIFIRRS